MRSLVFAFCVVLAFGGVDARADVWQPSAGLRQVPIWPGAAPDAVAVPGPEDCVTMAKLTTGQPVTVVNNVSVPTLTVYPPPGGQYWGGRGGVSGRGVQVPGDRPGGHRDL